MRTMRSLWKRFVRWLARDELRWQFFEGYRFGYDGGILDNWEYHDWLFMKHYKKHGIGSEWIEIEHARQKIPVWHEKGDGCQ